MLSTSSQIGRIYHGTATVIGSATPAMASVTSITTVHSPIATQEPCLTPACIRLATDVLDSLDTVYDPCESFYDFTCNGWVQKHPIPAEENSFSAMGELVKKNQDLIRTILESETVPESSADEQLLRKMRGLHRSCLDYDRLDELGSEPLVKVTKQVRQLFRSSPRPQESLSLVSRPRSTTSYNDTSVVHAYVHATKLLLIELASKHTGSETDPDEAVLTERGQGNNQKPLRSPDYDS